MPKFAKTTIEEFGKFTKELQEKTYEKLEGKVEQAPTYPKITKLLRLDLGDRFYL